MSNQEINEEIKKKIIGAIEELNVRFEGRFTVTIDEKSIKISNIVEKEIDRYEDAVPFHDKNACEYGAGCVCRFCRDWCGCMRSYREKKNKLIKD